VTRPLLGSFKNDTSRLTVHSYYWLLLKVKVKLSLCF